MKYRLIASTLLVVVLVALYAMFNKTGDESSAPATVQSTDDNQFKGLGK